MYQRTKLASSLLIALGLATPSVAFSQGSTGSGNKFKLEEVTVTARKVNESIQDIPLSIQAFTSETLVAQQVIDVEDIAQFTPGLHASNTTGGKNTPALRFRGVDTSNDRTQQTSSAFLDGVYIPGLSTWVSMNDIERVEVVKGPQSAFFGRSTFSGAINFISKTPGNEFGADVTAILGDNGRADMWLSAEGPIIKNKLSVRGGVRYYTYDGAWENNFPGGDNLGAQETQAYNVTLFATPTDDISIKLRYVTSEEDDGPAPTFLIEAPDNCGPFGGGDRTYFCGTLSRDLIEKGLAIDTRPPTAGPKRSLGMERENTMVTLNADWDVAGSGYTLSSTTGTYEQDLSEYRTFQEGILDLYSQWTDESFSQELRLVSPQDQRFRWMVGAYYLDLETWKDSLSGFPSTGPDDPRTPGAERGSQGGFGPASPIPGNKIKNKAVFASVAFDVTEQLTLSLELRREEETLETATFFTQEAMPLDSSTDELAISTAQPFGGAQVPASGEFKATLPRVIVDYKFSDNTMAYASYALGNNPGGFNPEVFQLEPTVALPNFQAVTGAGKTFEQAELASYEIGAKHSLADGRGFINGAVYMMEWTKQPFPGFEPFIDSNGDGRYVAGSDRLGGGVDFQKNGSTDIWGLELAGSYALTENWRASANYNYNKSDIQDLEDANAGRVLGDRQVAGNQLAASPEHAATLALDFNIPAANMFGQDGDWYGRWDSWYQSETYTAVINLAKTESAWMHNLRGGWRNDRYSVTAWVENVFDDDSVLAATRTTNFRTFAFGIGLSLPQPRTFGVTFSAKFGAE